MSLLVDVVAWSCACLAGVSVAYWMKTTAWIESRTMRAEPSEQLELPPVTILRPLKAGVHGLELELARFLREIRPGDQVIFGVEPGSREESICQSLVAGGHAPIHVVPCSKGAALNPKISKLIQMTPHSRHLHLIVLDSEFVADPGWLDRFRAEWGRGGADAMTAAYRFTGVESSFQQLDVLPVLSTLWPGLEVIRRNGPLKLMLGAVMAFERAALEEAGGWNALGDYLADDNRLGVLLAASGRRVELSRQIATLKADPLNWVGYWRHQRRVAVTYRACNPAGFAGSVCVQGVTLAIVAFCIKPESPIVAAVLLITCVVRIWTIRRLGRALSFPLGNSVIEPIVSNLVETTCWMLAWFSPTVMWAGRTFRVTSGGKLLATKAQRRPGVGCASPVAGEERYRRD